MAGKPQVKSKVRQPDKAFYKEARIRISHPKEPAEEWLDVSYTLAARALGVHRDTVDRWLSNYSRPQRRIPNMIQGYRLAQYLGIPMERLTWALGTGRSLYRSRPAIKPDAPGAGPQSPPS